MHLILAFCIILICVYCQHHTRILLQYLDNIFYNYCQRKVILSPYTVELGYNVMKGTEYFVSLQTGVIVTEECAVMVNSEQLIGTTEYLTL
jgi:hypothetical protein